MRWISAGVNGGVLSHDRLLASVSEISLDSEIGVVDAASYHYLLNDGRSVIDVCGDRGDIDDV